MIYDIFYVSTGLVNENSWNDFRKKFPASQKINNVKTFEDIRSKAFTKFFYVVWDDTVEINFDFAYRVTKWEEEYVHVWKTLRNGIETYQGGIALFPKNAKITTKEFSHKFYINKKEFDLVISKQVYPQYIINSYEEYKTIAETTGSPMFWLIWNNIEKLDESIFDLYYDPNNGEYDYDRNENHVYLNECNGKISFQNSIILCSKNKVFSSREFSRRYVVDKKEHNIKISVSRYPRFVISSYEEYENIINTTHSPMFWLIWNDVRIIDDNVFNLYFDPLDGKYDYDRNENHLFLNSSVDGDSHISGIILCSKQKKFSKKEFDHRFLIDKKEHSIVASKNKPYEIFKFSNYKEYQQALESASTEMFWMIPRDVVINDDFDFDFTFQFNNKYDKQINHVFLNDKYYDGVFLTPKHLKISEREIFHRFLIDKKEYPIQASKPKPFDIIFISYNEKNADENYENLKSKFPRSKRVHGVKGIQNAHIEAAKLSETDSFWVVDADAIIEEDFDFTIDYIPYYDRIGRINLNKTVHVWMSKNPINDLVYGYGGVKLLPKRLTMNMDIHNPDMTTSISDSFKIMHKVSNTTGFNVDEFSTWRSAFRECAKLASRVIDRNYEEETDEWLYVWCNVGKDRPFGKYAIHGARLGKQFGEEHMQDPAGLNLINDYQWLKDQFDQVKDKIK